jgi:hypothetical protein
MSRSSYRWIIVALGGLMGCVAMGAMFSLAVFLAPMSAETSWSRAGISFAMTINFIVLAFGSFGWGAAGSGGRHRIRTGRLPERNGSEADLECGTGSGLSTCVARDCNC